MTVRVMDEVGLEINISGGEKFKEMKVQKVERLIYMGIEIIPISNFSPPSIWVLKSPKNYGESNSEPAAVHLTIGG